MRNSGPWRPRLLSALLGLGLFAAAQASPLLPGTDLEVHRCQPPVAPEARAPQALRAARSAASRLASEVTSTFDRLLLTM